MPGRRVQEKVDKAGTGDLGALDQAVALAQVGEQSLGDLARGLAAGAGQLHGQVAGQIAVLGLLGLFHHKLGDLVHRGQVSGGAGAECKGG